MRVKHKHELFFNDDEIVARGPKFPQGWPGPLPPPAPAGAGAASPSPSPDPTPLQNYTRELKITANNC